jgi:ketosteroid isomerase-like protein
MMSLAPFVFVATLTSSATPLRATVDALFHAFNAHDVAGLSALYAQDARIISPDFCAPRTGADVPRTYRQIFDAFPDVRDVVETIVIDGDRAAVRFTSHSREFGSSGQMRLVTFLRVRGARIVEDDTTFDTEGRPCEP